MAENKPKDVRRSEILNVTSLLFAEKGYLGTSVDDICKKAKLTKGGLYWHFKSKKEILLNLVDDLCSNNLSMWKVLETIEITDDTIYQVGLQFINYNINNVSKIKLFNMLNQESLRNEEIKIALRGSRNIVHNELTKFSSRIFSYYNVTDGDTQSFAHILDIAVEGIVRKKILGLEDIDVESCWSNMAKMIISSL